MEGLNNEKEDELTCKGDIVEIAIIDRESTNNQNVDFGQEVLDVDSDATSEKTFAFSPYSGIEAQSEQDHHEAEFNLEKCEDIQFEILIDLTSDSHNGTYECSLCSGNFNSFPMLQMHLLDIHGVKVLSQELDAFCAKCGENVATADPNNGPVTCNRCKNICDKCKVTFKSKSAFTRHSMKNPYGQLYACVRCGEGFSSRCDLKIHEQTHKSLIPECNICGKEFSEKRRLKDHKDTNCGRDPFKCNKCGMGYFTRPQLHSHERSHEDPSQNTCPTCGRSFKYRRYLKVHMKEHTKEDLLMCNVCDKTFLNRSNFKAHLETHILNRRRDFVCEVCHKSFFSKRDLKLHVGRCHLSTVTQISDESGNTFMCKQCGRMCETESNLKEHEKTHIDNGPHDCKVCGKSFRYLASLQLHMRVHSQGLKFQCDICGYSCITKQGLAIHKVTHTNMPREPEKCKVPLVGAHSLKKQFGNQKDDGCLQDIEPTCLPSKQKTPPLEVDVSKDRTKECTATTSVDEITKGAVVEALPKSSMGTHYIACQESTQLQIVKGLLVCATDILVSLDMDQATVEIKEADTGKSVVENAQYVSLPATNSKDKSPGQLQHHGDADSNRDVDSEGSVESGDSNQSIDLEESVDSNQCVDSGESGDSNQGVDLEEIGDSNQSTDLEESGDSNQDVDSEESGDSNQSIDLEESGDSNQDVDSEGIGDSNQSIDLEESEDSNQGADSEENGDSNQNIDLEESVDSNQGVNSGEIRNLNHDADSEGSVAEQTHILYQCEICLATFEQRSAFDDHVVLHSESKLHTCHLCHKTYTRLVFLERHVKKHSSAVLLQCTYCDQQFISSRRLTTHKRNVHSDIISLNTSHKCSYCDAVFKTAGSCRFHEKKHKDGVLSKGTLYNCDECNRVFSGQGALTFHKKIHNKAHFPCQACDETFVTETAYDKHVALYHS